MNTTHRDDSTDPLEAAFGTVETADHATSYEWTPGTFARADEGLMRECAALYSSHYGMWASDAPAIAHNPIAGQPVRLSHKRIKEWLASDDSTISLARHSGELVGYAIAIRTKVPRYGVVTWVTQLVVHERYRRRDVAKNLLFSLWNFSDHFAWGLVSANPFAVRALEKATRRRCSPSRIKKHRDLLLNIAEEHVPYIGKTTENVVQDTESRINTEFYVDHSGIPKMIRDATQSGVPWLLGNLQPGWEWIAFTFSDQEQLRLTAEEITRMLDVSDQVVRQAYSRMSLDPAHAWARHTPAEAAFITTQCRLTPGDSVLDLGCGAGRHSLAIAASGISVVGVDYVPSLVSVAKGLADSRKLLDTRFIEADSRTLNLESEFSAVICLYDVIGSYADNRENFRILRTIARHLQPGGYALLSVMNLALTKAMARYTFSLTQDPNRLLDLRPSRTMQDTGNVFDPNFYMLDTDSNVVYRKEQFDRGTLLPTELIVRDRRFMPQEIASLVAAVGLTVEWVRCVRAGDWENNLPAEHERAKEILELCRKPEPVANPHGEAR